MSGEKGLIWFPKRELVGNSLNATMLWGFVLVQYNNRLHILYSQRMVLPNEHMSCIRLLSREVRKGNSNNRPSIGSTETPNSVASLRYSTEFGVKDLYFIRSEASSPLLSLWNSSVPRHILTEPH